MRAEETSIFHMLCILNFKVENRPRKSNGKPYQLKKKKSDKEHICRTSQPGIIQLPAPRIFGKSSLLAPRASKIELSSQGHKRDRPSPPPCQKTRFQQQFPLEHQLWRLKANSGSGLHSPWCSSGPGVSGPKIKILIDRNP